MVHQSEDNVWAGCMPFPHRTGLVIGSNLLPQLLVATPAGDKQRSQHERAKLEVSELHDRPPQLQVGLRLLQAYVPHIPPGRHWVFG